MGTTVIKGVTLTPLKRIHHPQGDVYHAMKSSEPSFSKFGEAYFSTVHSGNIKGWKKHHEMILNLVVPAGAVRFVVFDDRETSETKGKFFDVTLSKDNYCRLTVEPGLWMAFQGAGPDLNLLLNLASLEHNPAEATAIKLEEIKYEW